MKQYYQIIAFAICFLLLGLILFKKPDQVFNPSSNKTIVKNIDNSKDTILQLTTGIQNEKKIIRAFDLKLQTLYDSLERFKQLRDTFKIIQTQDTTINYLIAQGASKDSLILLQAGAIKQYEFITKSQDTLIAVKDFDLKRIKRQRNISFIGLGVLTGILIFK